VSPGNAQTRQSAEYLRRGLALGEGFALYVVAAQQLDTREDLVRSLCEDTRLSVAKVDVGQLDDAAIDGPIEAAQRKLAASDRRRVVVVTGLEELAERVPELMARLNEYRNELRARIEGAMIWLGTPVLLRLVQHQAPDVWSARAADLELLEARPSWRPPPLRPVAGDGATEGLALWQHELAQLPRSDQRGRVAMKLADALLELGEAHQRPARALYEQAVEELTDPAERALALVRAAGLQDSTLDDGAVAAARATMQELDEVVIDPELAARAWSGLARTCRARGRLDEAEEASIRAFRLAGRLDPGEVRAEVLAERAEQLTHEGCLGEALALWDEVLSLPQSVHARLGTLARAGVTAALSGRRDRLGHYWRWYLARGGQQQQLEAEIGGLAGAAASLAREVLIAPLSARSEEHYEPRLVRVPQDDRRHLLDVAFVMVSPRGGYELVKIPGGRFLMGSPASEPGHRRSEEPQREVELSGFFLGRYPVTNAQYGEFLRCNPEVEEPRFWGDRRFNHPRQPVVGVSWWDARSYCQWAGLTLPTEAQWEYACRAGTTTRYWPGSGEDDLALAGWYGEDPASGASHPVGEKAPNAFGLYDMHGNVNEWCEDTWTNGLFDTLRVGDGLRAQPVGALSRVVRGGSWITPAIGARSAHRYGRPARYRSFDLGFRPAAGHS
jgi:formylglycine-generating enzyme required for sulfatase activity